MTSWSRIVRLAVVPVLVALQGCGRGEDPGAHEVVVLDADEPGAAAGEDELGEVVHEDLDRQIFEEKLEWARAQGLAQQPVGDVVVALGRTFVGTKYTPATLEIEGPERLVLNLRELDCVTFVENMLALARTVRSGGGWEEFQRELRGIRYRGGVIDGYPSRLHYFSEWIRDNEEMRLVRDVTRDLGGIRDEEPITFMGMNPDAYPKMADTANVAEIRRIEQRLSGQPRYFIPEARVAEVEDRIQDGDILALTSTVEGLDVAHTGIAMRIDGRVHLLNAPLVGESVQISELPIAERLASIEGQDGLMVARPL